MRPNLRHISYGQELERIKDLLDFFSCHTPYTATIVLSFEDTGPSEIAQFIKKFRNSYTSKLRSVMLDVSLLQERKHENIRGTPSAFDSSVDEVRYIRT